MNRFTKWLKHQYTCFKVWRMRHGIRMVADYTDPTKSNRTGMKLMKAGVTGSATDHQGITPIYRQEEPIRDGNYSLRVTRYPNSEENDNGK